MRNIQGIKEGIKETRKKVIQEMLRDYQSYALIMKYTGTSDAEIRQAEKELQNI